MNIALRIIGDACAGLHSAHELLDESGVLLGLVHRDVSPQNILVSYDGAVKIVDFGVALAEGRSSDKTSAGTVKGKAPYMSPEQALGKTLDRRTDIFALGIVLYHLTTGRHPFRADNDILTLHNIIETEPQRPSAIVPTYPRPIESVVLKALEKKPEKRFQTMEEFEVALERALPPGQTRTRSSDVARFVRETVGDRGEKRRDALRNAVRLADERLQNELDTAKLAARPVAEIGLTAPTGITPLSVRSGLYPTVFDHATGLSRIATAPTAALPSFPISELGSLDNAPSSSLSATSSIGMVASTPPPSSAIPLTRPAPSRKGPLLLGIAAIAAIAGGAIVLSIQPTPATPAAAPVSSTATPVEPTTPPPPPATASAQETPPEPSNSAPAIDLNSLPSATPSPVSPNTKVPTFVGAKPPAQPNPTTPTAVTPATTPPTPPTPPKTGGNLDKSAAGINNPGF